LKDKDQSNQERDKVLLRMLHTAPKPKTGGKSSNNSEKEGPSKGLAPKSLQPLCESALESQPDPMPTDDPIALIEWGKRNIQGNDQSR
jgi:hypothetical protein